MNDTELIDELTQVVERQAYIIRHLHSVAKQMGATTSIDDEVASVIADAECITGG